MLRAGLFLLAHPQCDCASDYNTQQYCQCKGKQTVLHHDLGQDQQHRRGSGKSGPDKQNQPAADNCYCSHIDGINGASVSSRFQQNCQLFDRLRRHAGQTDKTDSQ